MESFTGRENKSKKENRTSKKNLDIDVIFFQVFFSTRNCIIYSGVRDSKDFLAPQRTNTHLYNEKERAFSSQQASAIVYVQSGMFLKGLVFSEGGLFH